MIVIDLTPLDVTLLAAGFSSLLALLFLWIIRSRLRAEIAAVARQMYPAEVAYQRFSAGVPSLLRWFILIVALVAALGAVANAQTPAGDQSGSPPWAIISGLLGSFFLPLVVYNLLSAPLVHQPALRHLRGLSVGAGELLTLRLKQAILIFCPFLLLGAVGLLFPTDDLLLVPLVVALVAYFILIGFVGAHILRWQVRTTPIEQTEWAALAPRIAAWQRLAGVRLRGVRVQQTGRLGYANVQIAGVLDRTLFLSDAFLAESDWRQRDALVAWALGYTRCVSSLASNRLVARLAIVATLAIVIMVIPVAAVLLPVDLSILVAVLPAVILIALVVFLLVSYRGRTSSIIAASDQFAAQLTGDPIALIVALSTLNAINGLPPQRKFGRHPSLASRVVALARLASWPGPRAPFAAQPIPSAVPVGLDGRLVTIPLDQTPPPAPIAPPPAPIP